VALVAGAGARDKVVQIDLPSADEVRQRLAEVAQRMRSRAE
jgi:hypothetical protein